MVKVVEALMPAMVEERIIAAVERRAERLREPRTPSTTHVEEIARTRLQRSDWQQEFIGPRRELLESVAARINGSLRPRGYELQLTDRARMPPYGTRILGFQVRGIAGDHVAESMIRFRLNNLGQVLVTAAHPLQFEQEPFGERIVPLQELTADLAAEIFTEFVEFVLER